jgi:signal peptidase I
MDPTFKTGEYLIVDELSYHFGEPERGSVLIFKYPKDPSKYFIKRVIGLPGETVQIKDGDVTIVNKENPKGFALNEPYVKFEKKDNLLVTLAAKEYFVMGDNRLGSADSRLWGPVPEDNIIGRPIIRFFPPSLFPGAKELE